jgi:hypothetical protein
MNETKSVFVCVLIILMSNVPLAAKDQASEAAVSPKQATPTTPIAAEKSVLAESSKPAATAGSAKDELCQCVDQKESAAAKRIEQALAGPLHSSGLEVADTPLASVLAQLQDEYGIPIQLDAPALDDAGIGTDAPVTRSLHNVSLRSALRLALAPLQLTWVIRDEVLMITTQEAADRHLVTCVYNVQGLVDDADPKSMEGLINAINSCVAPDSWSGNAGKHADIRPLKPGLLVVSQTPAIHEEVNGLLAKIRKVREQVPITKGRPHAQEPIDK